MTEYQGTGITGRKSISQVFPNSGVAKAVMYDTYLNTATGDVYGCTTPGDANTAEWEYRNTRVIKKPTVAVSSLSVARRSKGSHMIDATWKLPKAFAAETSCSRASGIWCQWILAVKRKTTQTVTTGKGKKRKTEKVVKWVAQTYTAKRYARGNSATSTSINLNSFTLSNGKPAGRATFYPSRNVLLLSVTVKLTPYNAVGEGKEAAVSKTIKFEKPRKPSLSAVSFNTETGTASLKVTTDPGEDKRERQWTEYEIKVFDSRSSNKGHIVSSSHVPDATGITITLSHDFASYASLTGEQYLQIHVKARSRGYAGDSEWVERNWYMARPKAPTVCPNKGKVTVSAKTSNGIVTVPVKVNTSTTRPVDKVRLQALVDVEYAKASSIPANAQWEDMDATDDAQCTALTANASDLAPSRGNHSYIRVKAWRISEAQLQAYSSIVEVPLYTAPASQPSAADNACEIVSASAGDDGESVDLVIGWDRTSASGDSDTTGIELTWSDDAGAWKSTQAPSMHEFTWRDDEPDDAATAAGWLRSATIAVKKLEEGVEYHFRARCFADDAEGNRTYGPYSPAAAVQTATTPPSVTLASSLQSFSEGRSVPFTWVLAASSPQTAWQLLSTANAGAPLASGEGAEGAFTLDADRAAGAVVGGSLTCVVRCSTGSAWTTSNEVSLAFAEAPTMTVAAPTLTAQPMSFTAEATEALPSVGYVVSEPDGDVVASDVTAPVWAEVEWGATLEHAALADRLAEAEAALAELESGDDGYEEAAALAAELEAALAAGGVRYQATITLPDQLAFEDAQRYVLTAWGTASSGLGTGEVESPFAVDWSHKSPGPSEGIEVVPETVVDSAGRVTRRCTVALAAPDGAAPTDVYDVYRVTHDGADLVSPADGFPLDHTFVDDYAPYGDAGDYAYRVALRTADGDVEWDDFNYLLDCRALRIDFAGRYVELPYSIEVSDGYQKDVDIRMHLDGSVAAHYNRAIARKATLGTQMLRIDDASTAAEVRALAQHAGTAFVRTPDGSAYEADVQVKEIDVGHAVLAVSIEAEQVDTSEGFGLPAVVGEEGE